MLVQMGAFEFRLWEVATMRISTQQRGLMCMSMCYLREMRHV
jgi:hypothetical protein